jgi:hypothetical protein
MTVQFNLLKTPSNSKGWARYKASVDGAKLIASRTGNEFVSASHAGETAEGVLITLTTDMMLRVGKGRTARETRQGDTYRLIADPAAKCEIGNCVSHLHIVIEGARLAEASA